MAIQRLDHVNICTSRPEETMSFYTAILDFTEDFRPPLVFSDNIPKETQNVVDHIAFEAVGFEETKRRLENANWEFRCSEVPDSKIRQIFLHDPNGVKLELNFKF